MTLISYSQHRDGRVFDVDLAAPAIDRFRAIGRELGDELHDLLADVVELCEENLSGVPRMLRPLAKAALHGASRLGGSVIGTVASWYGGEYVAEIKGLAKALRLESATAICHHWQVTPQTVTRWRNQLGIGPNTAGSRELRRDHGKRNFPKVKPKLRSKAHDPERAAKIAATKRGKPRPPEVIEAMREAKVGRKLSAKHRRKLSEAQRRRHADHPRPDRWTSDEDGIIRTCSTDEAVRRTGRSLKAVQLRRHRLKVPDGRRRRD